jgi:hypothetical protein
MCGRFDLSGSPSLCGLVVAEERKEPSAKEFGPGTAVHLSLQSLEAVNLPLGLTIAPKLTDCILKSIKKWGLKPQATDSTRENPIRHWMRHRKHWRSVGYSGLILRLLSRLFNAFSLPIPHFFMLSSYLHAGLSGHRLTQYGGILFSVRKRLNLVDAEKASYPPRVTSSDWTVI